MSKSKFRPIDIDFEVYQLIVLEKHDFDESDNDALRRLLGFNDSPVEHNPPLRRGGRSWWSKGVELPEGTSLKMIYSGIEYVGTVVGGKWKVGEKYYNTPSQAASGVACTKTGNKTQLNGWKYWIVKRPSDTDWILLDKLRSNMKL